MHDTVTSKHAPTNAPKINAIRMSVMSRSFPFLTNRFKICYITDVVSVQFASAGTIIILDECALVVDT